MFGRIAPVYDGMNHAMSAGFDRRWRRLAADAVVAKGDRVLDACCGTGDLALAARSAGGIVTGLDFSDAMLERARRKSSEIEWVEGNLLHLPFADGSFDTATVGFGVRNVDDLDSALREFRRRGVQLPSCERASIPGPGRAHRTCSRGGLPPGGAPAAGRRHRRPGRRGSQVTRP